MPHEQDRTLETLKQRLADNLRKRMDADMQRGMEAIQVLAKLGIQVRLDEPLTLSKKARAHRIKNPKETLPDAIARVLASAGSTGLTVSGIAAQLSAEGRDFGSTRPEALISSALARRHKAMGWISEGERPQRWRTKGGDST